MGKSLECFLDGHTWNKAIADLSEAALFYVDGGAFSTMLLLEPCLPTTSIGEADLQVTMTTLFTEDEWANEEQVLTFEGDEAAQAHIYEFRKTASFERRNLAVPYSVRKKIAEN